MNKQFSPCHQAGIDVTKPPPPIYNPLHKNTHDMRADVNSVVWGTLDIFEQTFVFWGILGNSPLYTVRKLTTHHYL